MLYNAGEILKRLMFTSETCQHGVITPATFTPADSHTHSIYLGTDTAHRATKTTLVDYLHVDSVHEALAALRMARGRGEIPLTYFVYTVHRTHTHPHEAGLLARYCMHTTLICTCSPA